MKTLAISDLHGRSFSTIYYQLTALYKNIDYIVQLGDWFDTEVHAYHSSFQIANFKQMLKIKRKNPNVHLLIGNHDATYLYGNDSYYSIHCFGREKEIHDLIEENIKDIEYCFFDGKYLYSHAGISLSLMQDLGINNPLDLNEMLHNKDYKLFTTKYGLLGRRVSGVKEYYEFEDLIKNKFDVTQVIGHYSSMGMQYMDGLIDIEDYKHGNSMLFYS